MGPAFLRKYNTLLVAGTTSIRIPIIKAGSSDFAVSGDWTPSAGDVKVKPDDGAVANITNLPTAITMGNTAVWEFILTASELSCKQLMITVADAATKAVEDQAFIVETFGNASAMYQYDPQDGTRLGLTALPNAAADGAGGLPVSDAGGLDLDTLLGYLDAAISSRSTLSAADVNSEVLDVLTVDTFSEPGSVPAATSSIKDKIGWLFTRLRNKRDQDATTQTLYKDDGTTSLATSSTSDDGTTATLGEWT